MAFEDALRDITGALGMAFAPEQAMQMKKIAYEKQQALINQTNDAVQTGAMSPEQQAQIYQQNKIHAPIMQPNVATVQHREQLREKQQDYDTLQSQKPAMVEAVTNMKDLDPQKKQLVISSINSARSMADLTTLRNNLISPPQSFYAGVGQNGQPTQMGINKMTGEQVDYGKKYEKPSAGGSEFSGGAVSLENAKKRVEFAIASGDIGKAFSGVAYRDQKSRSIINQELDRQMGGKTGQPEISGGDLRQTQITTNSAKRTDWQFTSGTQANTIRSLHVADQHLDVMDKLITAIGNRDVKLWNTSSNEWLKQTGSALPTNIEAAAQIVGPEIAKAVIGTGAGTGEERQALAQQFAIAKSPEQLRGAEQTYKKLIAGQLQGLADQYKGGTGKNDFYERFNLKAPGVKTPVDQNAKAIEWARAHPEDPRAKQILELHGKQNG